MEKPLCDEGKKEVLISTYESLLYTLRKREKEILNYKRSLEYEKNRPPVSKWYTLTTPQFSQEVVRNRLWSKVISILTCSLKMEGKVISISWRLQISINFIEHGIYGE